MTLQLRVRHSLGARMMQLESRSATRPIRIGRDPEAEVQIPSSAVAPMHCRLYCQDDQWVIEDCGGAGGTLVNGSPITQATYLKSGDAITLGGSGASIEIDPVGLLRRSAAAAARPAAPTEDTIAAQSIVDDSAPANGDPQYEEQALDSVEMQTAEPAALASGEAEGDDGSEQAQLWAAQPASAAIVAGWPQKRAHYGYRRRKTNPTGWIALGVTLGVIIVFGAILIGIIFKKEDPRPRVIASPEKKKPVVEEKKPEPVVVPLKKKKNIFDDDPGPQKTVTVPPEPLAGTSASPAPVPPPANVDAQPVAGQSRPERPPADPRTQTEDWKNLLETNAGSNYARAIWVNEDYRQRHPGELEDEVKKKTSEALDSLWWQRIRELCQTRQRTGKEVQKLTEDIAAETEAAYKKKLEADRQKKQELIASITSALADDYAYSATEPPNEYDVEQIAKLRAARDAGKYGRWCERVVKYIRTENGALPWQSR